MTTTATDLDEKLARVDEMLTHLDGWSNALTGQGMAAYDSRLAGTIQKRAPLTVAEADALYAQDHIAAKVCDMPAEDMTREWIDIRAAVKAGGEQRDVGESTLQYLEERDAQERLTEGICWGRLYGGGLVFVGADDGKDKRMEEPLDEANIRTIRFLTTLDRHDVTVGRYDDDPASKTYGQPEVYDLVSASVDGVRRIHRTRMLRFEGVRTGKRRRRELQGWTDSVLQRMVDIIRDHQSSYAGVASMLADFNVAALKIPNLSQKLLSAGGSDQVRTRLAALNLSRSIHRMLVLDEKEELANVAKVVTGLHELLDRLGGQLSAATDMPQTKLFGRSPGGLNATGDSDDRSWYDRVSSMQENTLRPRLERLIRLVFLAKDGPTKGAEPDSWSFSFRPLWQPSEREQAEVYEIRARGDDIYNRMGLPSEDIVASRHADGRAGITIKPREEEQVESRQTLPGVLVQSMIETVRQAAEGSIPRESALHLLMAAAQLSQEEANRLLSSAGAGFVPTSKENADGMTSAIHVRRHVLDAAIGVMTSAADPQARELARLLVGESRRLQRYAAARGATA